MIKIKKARDRKGYFKEKKASYGNKICCLQLTKKLYKINHLNNFI